MADRGNAERPSDDAERPSGGAEPASRVGISVTRIFDASPEDVWKEWTEPARFADWFGGPSGQVPLDSVSMDVREGGALRLTMVVDHGARRIEWSGNYLEVVPPERLTFTITDQTGGGDHDVVSVILTDLGDGRTEMYFEQRGRQSPEQYRRAESGWSGFFDRLAEHLVNFEEST